MADVQCARCGRTTQGLDRPPLPGRPGEAVLEQVCKACWEEWKGVQVKLINEYRIDVTSPDSYDRLVREMGTFLSLREEAGEGEPGRSG